MKTKNESRLEEIKFQAIEYIYDSVFREFVYKNRENMSPFYEQIQEMAGDAGDFFSDWAKGFVALADFDFAEAEKRYENAFKNKCFACKRLSSAFFAAGFRAFYVR